ncbi:Golgi membrane protein 1 [Moschus berezovskii]|nr:Golgi membrane protein 1 [Moschus berezovskii]
MMGLGNGRRSMKSPPLVLAALVACIIVLGFNYWIASSRSVDLQTRIVELEGRVRRAAAERGAVEMKKNEFQGELEKQREQLDKIQSSHNFQMESVNKLYQDEKILASLDLQTRSSSLFLHLPSMSVSSPLLFSRSDWGPPPPGSPRRYYSYLTSVQTLILNERRLASLVKPPGSTLGHLEMSGAGLFLVGDAHCRGEGAANCGRGEGLRAAEHAARWRPYKIKNAPPSYEHGVPPLNVAGFQNMVLCRKMFLFERLRGGTGTHFREALASTNVRSKGSPVKFKRCLSYVVLHITHRFSRIERREVLYSQSLYLVGRAHVARFFDGWFPRHSTRGKIDTLVPILIYIGIRTFVLTSSVFSSHMVPYRMLICSPKIIVMAHRSSVLCIASGLFDKKIEIECLAARSRKVSTAPMPHANSERPEVTAVLSFAFVHLHRNQCISQMKEVKEQCEERIEEVTRRGNEAMPSRDLNEQKDQSQQPRAPSEPQPRPQEAGPPQAEVPEARGNVPSHSEPQTPAPSSEVAFDLKRQGEKEETKEIQVVSEEELQRDSLALPKEPGREQAVEGDRQVGGKDNGEPGELGQIPQVPAALLASQENQEAEGPERDQLVIRDGQEEGQDADGEGRNQQKLGADDDYNVDENEAESETDKQAALAGNDKNRNVLNAENQKGDTINLLDQREKRNHTL